MQLSPSDVDTVLEILLAEDFAITGFESEPETLPAPRMCIVDACDRGATWHAEQSLGDYCEAHAREWLMAEDREDFAREYANEARDEARGDW